MVWTTFLWGGAFVYAVTGGLIAWVLLRYKKRRSGTCAQTPARFRENPPLELTYTVLPLLMVVGLFAITFAAERHVENVSAAPALTVNVTGFRWSWRFEYPAQHISVSGTPQAPPQLVLPLGRTVRLNLTSVDVNHAFWVPAFLFKRDAIPGLVNRFDLTPTIPGIKRGECVEFCGLEHARMTFTVNVVSPRDFSAWARQAARQGAGASP